MRIPIQAVLCALACALALPAFASATVTEGTGWEATSSVSPTNLSPGGTGEIQLDIINVGAETEFWRYHGDRHVAARGERHGSGWHAQCTH